MADDKTVVNTNITEFREKLDAYRKTHPTQATVTKIYDSEESIKLQEEAEQLGLNFDSEVEQSHKREVDEFRKKLDAYRKDNPTDDYTYLYDTDESVALESEADKLGLDIDAELEASHNRDIDNFRQKLDAYRKDNPTDDYTYLYDTDESVELEVEAYELGLDLEAEIESSHTRELKEQDNREKEKSNRINLRHGTRMQNKYSSKKEENLSNDFDSKARITPNGAIIGDPPRYLGASIGDKLKGTYEVRQIRKGQIQYAGKTIRETTRDPEIDKGGQEYDE